MVQISPRVVPQSITSERRIKPLLANDRRPATHPYLRPFPTSAPGSEPQISAMAWKDQLSSLPTTRILHAQPSLVDALCEVKTS